MPPDGLTPQARRMLAILRDRGDWMTCDALAKALYYPVITPYERTLLKHMAKMGLIEICRYRAKSRVYTFKYRATP